MSIDNLQTEQFRDLTVTDVEFVFDFGIKDLITLYDGDVIQHNTAAGTIDVIFAPKDSRRFPEYVSYQISKIIVQRTQQRIMRVRVTPPVTPHPPAPLPEAEAVASVPPVIAPESSSPADSDSPAAASPSRRPASPAPGRPRRRRTTQRSADTPDTPTALPFDPPVATGGQTSVPATAADHPEEA
jgi:hypothetical protein